MVPMLRWERCSSGRFPSRNPDNTKVKCMITCFFLRLIKIFFFSFRHLDYTYEHGSSRSDFGPVALKKLDNGDVIKVQHAGKVLNLGIKKE